MSKAKGKDNEPKWDKDLEPFMKVLLSKKGIKMAMSSGGLRSADIEKQKKTDYFSGRHFKKWLLMRETKDLLQKKCKGALEKAECKSSKDDAEGEDTAEKRWEKDILRLGQELMNRGFIRKAVLPKSVVQSTSSTASKTKKIPDRLDYAPPKLPFDAEKDSYYTIEYEGDSTYQHMLLALIIVGVLLICMWPVWPLWAKIGIWYLSVIFLSLYFGVLIIRLVIYVLFWIVGFDFWIFPNLNDERMGVLDSFKPAYEWEKRNDDMLMLLVRFGSLAIMAVAIEQISQTCSLTDFSELVTHSYSDLLDWGVDKILALPGSERQALPSVEELSNLGDDEGNSSGSTETTKTVESVAPGAEDDGAEEVNVD